MSFWRSNLYVISIVEPVYRDSFGSDGPHEEISQAITVQMRTREFFHARVDLRSAHTLFSRDRVSPQMVTELSAPRSAVFRLSISMLRPPFAPHALRETHSPAIAHPPQPCI